MKPEVVPVARGKRDAEIGSDDWANATRLDLLREVKDIGRSACDVGQTLDAIINHRAWEKMNKKDGSTFSSLEEFCTYPSPWGLGRPVSEILKHLGLVRDGAKFKALFPASSHPVERLPLAAIRRDGGTQVRAEMASATVDEYRTALDAGAAFPPVVVFHDGADHWLADGFHRVEAHEAAGLVDVLAEVRLGTREDAIIHATGANKAHGLPMTASDRRRAIDALLKTEKWRGESARKVAAHVGVSHHTVVKVMEEQAVGQNAQLPQTRTGKDGKQYPTKHKAKSTEETTSPKVERSPHTDLIDAITNAADLAALDKAYSVASHASLTEVEADDAGDAYRRRAMELRVAAEDVDAEALAKQLAASVETMTYTTHEKVMDAIVAAHSGKAISPDQWRALDQSWWAKFNAIRDELAKADPAVIGTRAPYDQREQVPSARPALSTSEGNTPDVEPDCGNPKSPDAAKAPVQTDLWAPSSTIEIGGAGVAMPAPMAPSADPPVASREAVARLAALVNHPDLPTDIHGLIVQMADEIEKRAADRGVKP